MTHVTCCPEHLLPDSLDFNRLYITMFNRSSRHDVGHVGLDVPRAVVRSKLAPSVNAWDFATISLAVDAVDKSILRKNSADGWTREIDLTIHLVNPAIWMPLKAELESLLRFLTGDFWILHFLPGGLTVPSAKNPASRDADCLCLLSGGVDSLIGAIDLAYAGRRPLYVSHIVRGSGDAQRHFASTLDGLHRHLQWSCTTKNIGIPEKSTRARSIVFFAFSALAASGVSEAGSSPVEIVVPENGFISLNVPLSPGRIGSLSTKTTHPVYMSGIQSLWDAAGINAQLTFPYRYKTKGEMLVECSDQPKLIGLLAKSVSCGKYQHYALQHCGECVPCMIRRAAFQHAGIDDTTVRGYRRVDLRYAESKDVAAAANACIRFREQGIYRFSAGALSFAPHQDRSMYEGVVTRGIEELERLLASHGAV